jgi:hypothetical protein
VAQHKSFSVTNIWEGAGPIKVHKVEKPKDKFCKMKEVSMETIWPINRGEKKKHPPSALSHA